MKSRWVTVLAGLVAAVVAVSVVIGLNSPDGSVGDTEVRPAASSGSGTPDAPASDPSPTPSPARTSGPSADRAPVAVRGTWPGRPRAATLRGSRVDWCRAVETRGAAEAVQVFGQDATDAAACAAVRFMFEQRYSRLSLPRTSYAADDLDFALAALTDSTAQTYRPRIDRFVADPDSRAARDDLGLVLLRGEGTGGADHAVAGGNTVFYGPAFTTRGYRGRAAWINPTWSTVTLRVDRSRSTPRLEATLEASAAVPVFDTSSQRDAMMTVPTSAVLLLRHEGGTSWRLGGWTHITTGSPAYAPLDVR